MEYPFITLDDGTQISHSEMLADRSVLVQPMTVPTL